MRNFPLVPHSQQKGLTADEILANKPAPKTEKCAFKSSTDNGYKAYEMVNGEYVKWTTKAYATKEEALANLN
jgi:hypothetical protein